MSYSHNFHRLFLLSLSPPLSSFHPLPLSDLTAMSHSNWPSASGEKEKGRQSFRKFILCEILFLNITLVRIPRLYLFIYCFRQRKNKKLENFLLLADVLLITSGGLLSSRSVLREYSLSLSNVFRLRYIRLLYDFQSSLRVVRVFLCRLKT